MTPESQRIAIAKACGKSSEGHWRCLSCNREVAAGAVTFSETHDGCGHSVEWVEVPDYLNDLNAMHEAEKTLTLEQLFDMSEHVVDITHAWSGCDIGVPDLDISKIMHATAAQHAEAFLRTIGKWEDSK